MSYEAKEPKESRTPKDSSKPDDEVTDPSIPTPAHPTLEELPEEAIAPAAIDPTAVDTVIGGKKFGWQNEPIRPFADPEICVHIGVVSARAQLAVHDVGHEWICTCGEVHVVVINAGGKKTLVPKADLE